MNKLILLLLAAMPSLSSKPPLPKCNPSLTINNMTSPNNPFNITVSSVKIHNWTDDTEQVYDYPSFPFYPDVTAGPLEIRYQLDGLHSGCISAFEGSNCHGTRVN